MLTSISCFVGVGPMHGFSFFGFCVKAGGGGVNLLRAGTRVSLDTYVNVRRTYTHL